MKIAISSSGDNLQSAVDSRFGRCMNFIIIEISEMSLTVHQNSAQFVGHGAGTKAAQDLLKFGVSAVISGNIGPNAFQVLRAANIRMYTSSGTIENAVEAFKKGNLVEMTHPSNAGHMGRGS
ncbi:MAG: NifB/NifX family molybdenum-iron cluster-binding protein, partial [Candidatus Heimdallarchaeota archaeon]|nr:NifB/NifX family molybdenum-iron cluster-binding protein [Candidatus Heimdallarchaeota archaeon]